MTSLYYKDKKYIYKWRDTHKEQHKENQRKYQKKYHNWKVIQKEFLNILIDF